MCSHSKRKDSATNLIPTARPPFPKEDQGNTSDIGRLWETQAIHATMTL
jgi:hypothetical protein